MLRHLTASVGAHPAAVAYAMTTLGASMMNSIFNFYYVKLFLNKYQISEGAFHQSQVSLSAEMQAHNCSKCFFFYFELNPLQ